MKPPAKSPAPQAPILATLSLVVREERLPPLGQAPSLDRPISFATTFVHLQNPQMEKVEVVLQQLEIIGDRPTPFMALETPQVITLMPLENAVVEVPLTSLEPYPRSGDVRAIALYSIDGLTYRCESPAVPINRS